MQNLLGKYSSYDILSKGYYIDFTIDEILRNPENIFSIIDDDNLRRNYFFLNFYSNRNNVKCS